MIIWAISSAGRAPALQAGCRQFNPVIAHHLLLDELSYIKYMTIILSLIICFYSFSSMKEAGKGGLIKNT
jgi:hypothetical protein